MPPLASVPEDPAPATAGEDDYALIEVDDSDEYDYDSSFTGVTNSCTPSVSSSILEYRYENGRRYQAWREGFQLPNDEMEQDRLDMFHHAFTLILGGKLYTAPLNNPQRVLDIGTGTGAWAIDFADENEQAMVLGIDLSPIQPTWVRPNVSFEVDDVEQPWMYDENSFDYIHVRMLSGSFKDWQGFLTQSFEHLQPGGYFEFQDYGAELFHNSGRVPDSAFSIWWNTSTGTGATVGRPWVVAKHMKTWMEEAGFVDVHVRKEIWPLGPWPKDPKLRERGRWGQLGHIDSLETLGLAMLHRVAGWTVDEVKELCRKAKQELLAKDNRYYNEVWFIYGKKPEDCGLAEAE